MESQQVTRPQFDFVLLLPTIEDLTEEIVDLIYNSGCNDALIGTQNGLVFLDFTRQSQTLDEAIQSAIFDLQSVNLKAVLA